MKLTLATALAVATVFLATSVRSTMAAAGDGITREQGVSDESILAYKPNTVANVVFAATYLTLSAFLFAHVIRRREWFALCLPIGALFSGVGFPLRIVYGNNPTLGLYIAADFCIVLAPMAYFAWNYLWFGRLAANMEADPRVPKLLAKESGSGSTAPHHLTWISPRKMKAWFVTSDVLTFFVQAGGGGMQVSPDLAPTGSKIFLAGIILQALSYLIFLALVFRARWLCRGMRSHPLGISIDYALYTLYFSSVWIIVRSVYRTIELAAGYEGVFFRTELWFLILDAAPLALAIGVYVFFWPSRFVPLRPHPLGFPDQCPDLTDDYGRHGGGGFELASALPGDAKSWA